MKQTFFHAHAVKINRHLKILAAVRDLLHRSLAKFEVADSVALAVGKMVDLLDRKCLAK